MIIFLGCSLLAQTQIKNLEELKKKYPDLKKYNEQTINGLGYRLIQAGDIKEALEVFELNTLLYPHSWNVYDSLGEAYMILGDTESAKKSYTKSLQINPKNIHGKRILGKLNHPEWAPFTGDFEFYIDFKYVMRSVYIEDGNMTVTYDRSHSILLKPVDRKKGEFQGISKDNTQLLTFLENEQGNITQVKWIEGEQEFFGSKKTGSYLKDTYSVKEMQEDFFQFRKHIEEVHPCPYEFTSKESFDRAFESQYEKISGPMSLRQFYNVLAPLKGKIGCGHAHLDYPAEYRNKFQVYKFPLILRFIENKCYVIKNLNENSSLPLYSEIVSLNDIKVTRIKQTLKEEISADGHNDSFKCSALENCFQYYYANHFGAPKEFRIEYRTGKNGDIQQAVVPALPCSGINYSNQVPKDLKEEIFPEKDAAVLTINSFVYYGEKNKIFFSFIDQAFRKIKENNIKNLIIDLRGNGGGDPFCASYLFSYIEKEPQIYFSKPYGKYADLAKPIKLAENHFNGNLFFLIDGADFSTTGHFCALLKYHNLGTFIGTETGGTYTCNAAVRTFDLKHTRIILKLATGSYAATVSGLPKNRGIFPDHMVKTSIEDLKNNRDRALEYTFGLIDKK